MKRQKLWQSKWCLLAAAVVVIACLTGCGALMTLETSRKIYDKDNNITKPTSGTDWFLVDLSKRYGLMALFAETSYRRDLDDSVRDAEGCKYLEAGRESERSRGMPKAQNSTAGWERWVPTEPTGEKPCINEDGLFYETYVYFDESRHITEAVIAFRGTENTWSQWYRDWSTSMSAALGLEPHQYAIARAHLPALIARIEAAGSDVKIYATGHSLGGGLAQQAGYLSASIREVFTFNTSPVTNWTKLRRQHLVKQGFPIIHRIYHGGEFLETPRFVATSVTSARYGRHDVGVQFSDRQAAKGHSMKILACNFASLLSETKEEADHRYPIEYIKAHVLRSGIKPDPVDPRICDDQPGDEDDSAS